MNAGSHVIGASNLCDSPVAGHHQDGRQVILQRPIQVAEALHIQHVHLQSIQEGSYSQQHAMYGDDDCKETALGQQSVWHL